MLKNGIRACSNFSLVVLFSISNQSKMSKYVSLTQKEGQNEAQLDKNSICMIGLSLAPDGSAGVM